MNDHATERLELETQLRRALENNELSVMYQPLVSIKTGKIIGCEALARWDHPTRGRISPTRFIQIAEEIGVIIPIGYWVLETACRQMKEWHTALGSETLTMSVNLSGKQVQRKDVVARVQEILTRTELKPDCLKLEITETVLMSDHDAVPKLMSLKELGVKLALDDFGTGYSSLATLSTFPVDTLKIDRAFIRRVEEEAEARAIVEAIMALSRSLKMDVTSEGVENFFQLAYVGQLGCATGQGFLFSKPLVADEFWNRLMAGGRYGAANSAIQDLDSSVTDSTDGEQAA
jgi:EAL domain-containing protein (putative c-di-GMP-specific phosphodiesterase class I)